MCARFSGQRSRRDRFLRVLTITKISPLYDIQNLQKAIDEGRAADQKALFRQLDAMDADPRELEKGLGARHTL